MDLRAAVRGLLHHRSVTVLAVACLALGVGTSGAMLGLLDALLYRPPTHVVEPWSVRRLYFQDTFPGIGESTSISTSYPALLDLQKVRSFSAVGGFFSTKSSLGRGAEAQKVRTVVATPGFLRLLGVQPIMGRLISDSEGAPGQPGLVVLLSYELWQRSFGGTPDVLGQQVIVGNHSYTVVGVLPRRFTGVDLEAVDLWLPINASSWLFEPQWAEERGDRFLRIVARLRPGVGERVASQEATTVLRASAAEAGETGSQTRTSLGAIQKAQGPGDQQSLGTVVSLTGLSWVVLLIACANVASLLLLRGLDRQRELGLRLALGAGRGRLARLMLIEGALLAVLGGIAALGVCRWVSAFLQRLILPDVREPVATLDLRTLAIVAVLIVTAGALSGLAPALWAGRRDLLASIRAGARERTSTRSRLDAALSAGQIALTLALLAGAGVFARSLQNVLHLDLGLDADRILVVTLDLGGAGVPPRRVDEIYQQAAERVKSLPGVQQESLAATIPFSTSTALELTVPGVPTLPQTRAGVPYVNAVTPSFFATTGTRIVNGRSFTPLDRASSAPVAIVNETMARLLWPDRDPLGQCLKIGSKTAPCSEVVGVARDARRQRLQEEPTMQYYVPLGQEPPDLSSRALFVRAAGDPEALRGPLRREVLAVTPDLPFVDVQLLSDLIAPQVRPWRMGTAVLTLFSLLALVLALAGLYGVVAHAMARRSYEMGVRIALGAQWRDVLWLALRHGLMIGLLGAVAGLALVLAAAHLLQPLLFQVSAKDPLVLACAAVLVLALALLASYIPGRRLRRLDPAMALRAE